jgi:hypothetical protein
VLRPKTRAVAATAALVLTLATSGCGDDDGGGGGSTDEVKTIEITFADGDVTPSGERVEVGVGQKIDLEVTADEPGELHVHSEPEQELEYDEGETTLKLQIDRPGIVEVESHDLDKVIVQLEVK